MTTPDEIRPAPIMVGRISLFIPQKHPLT